MSKRFRFLSTILLSLFAIGQSAFAEQPICKSIQECQTVISQAEARLQELSNGGSSKRTSSTGAIFTPDTSNPSLGEAYKDPSGLIWGRLVMAHGETNPMSQYDADKYCKDGGARLPTKEEFEQLAKYLGKGTANGYNPYLADGKTDLLPGLSGHWFWSSSVSPNGTDNAFSFNGYNGLVYYGSRSSSYAVRCVAGR